jgi:hypothetical protein
VQVVSYNLIMFAYYEWGLGIGDWGLGAEQIPFFFQAIAFPVGF